MSAKSFSGSSHQLFTIEQIELIRRLRNSGITKEQVVEAFDRFERIDQELGLLYSIPMTYANSLMTKRFNGQYPIYSVPHTFPSSPQGESKSDGQPSNKRPREDSTENIIIDEPLTIGNNTSSSSSTSSSNNISNTPTTTNNTTTTTNDEPQLVLATVDQDEMEDLQEFMKQGISKMYEEIKSFVNRVGLKQSQIAAMTGISQSYVSRYLRGEYTEMSERCRRAIYAWYVAHRRRLIARSPRFTSGEPLDMQFTPKRERFTFREKHLEVLEAYFKENQYPTMEMRDEIAQMCNMALSSTGRELSEKEKVTQQIVSNWFNNRRKEIKKLAKEGGVDCSHVFLPSRIRASRTFMIDLENPLDQSESAYTPSPRPSETNDEQSSSFAADVAAVNRAISALAGETIETPVVIKEEPVSDTEEKIQKDPAHVE